MYRYINIYAEKICKAGTSESTCKSVSYFTIFFIQLCSRIENNKKNCYTAFKIKLFLATAYGSAKGNFDQTLLKGVF